MKSNKVKRTSTRPLLRGGMLALIDDPQPA